MHFARFFVSLHSKNKTRDMTETTKKKRTREENIAINSKKTPRSQTMIFAMSHKGMLIVNDPELERKLCGYY